MGLIKGAELTIYIDGAARGNPGPAGLGVVLMQDQGDGFKSVKSFCKYLGEMTNNSAEYLALIYGLQEALILGYKKVRVRTDSELIAKQLRGEYRVKEQSLRMYYEQALHLKQGFEDITIEMIAREENKAADKLANKAIDSKEQVSKPGSVF